MNIFFSLNQLINNTSIFITAVDRQMEYKGRAQAVVGAGRQRCRLERRIAVLRHVDGHVQRADDVRWPLRKHQHHVAGAGQLPPVQLLYRHDDRWANFLENVWIFCTVWIIVLVYSHVFIYRRIFMVYFYLLFFTRPISFLKPFYKQIKQSYYCINRWMQNTDLLSAFYNRNRVWSSHTLWIL